MAENSKIEWTDHTFNPWRGCTKVAQGCTNCYAETMSKRNPGTLGIWGNDGTRVIAADAMWKKPLKWAKDARKQVHITPEYNWRDVWHTPCGDSSCAPMIHRNEYLTSEDGSRFRLFECTRCGAKVYGGLAASRVITTKPHRPRVFCGSMCDVFEDRPDLVEPRARLFDLILATPELDWLLLTKRPENVVPLLNGPVFAESTFDPSWPLSGLPANVWLGTSAACQEDYDRNWGHLSQVPAARYFISYEPGVEPIDFMLDIGPRSLNPDWIIVGGESGPNARPFDVAWARSTVKQCKAAGVPVFVKQLGAKPTMSGVVFAAECPAGIECEHGFDVCPKCDGGQRSLPIKHPKGADMSEWPEDLRVREFPEVAS